MNEFYMGIEGMAAKFSVGVLSNTNGDILSAIKGQPLASHTLPEDILFIRINDIINSLIQEAGLQRNILSNTNLCIGIGGTTFSYDREIYLKERILDAIRPNFKKVICTGDAEIAFLSNARVNNGSIVVSQLGSTVVTVGENDNKLNYTRFGGWGPVFGDEGSSFHMGLEVLRLISKSYDNKSQLSPLWFKVDEWLTKPEPYYRLWKKGSLCWQDAKDEFSHCTENRDPRKLLFYFSHYFNNHFGSNEGFELWRSITGGLFIPLMKAYDEDDDEAKSVINKGINSLVEQHYGASSTSGLDSFEPIVLFGGVFNHNEKFVELFKQELQIKYNRNLNFITRFSEYSMRPVCGALLFSLSNSHTNNLKMPDDKLVEKIFQNQKNSKYNEVLKNN